MRDDLLETIGGALEDVWDNLFLGAGCSLLWLAAMLLVIPGPPATVALAELARRVRERESPSLGDYWRLIGRRFGLGWRWAAIAWPVALLLIADWWLAPRLFAAGPAQALRLLSLLALAAWSLLHFYAVPLLFVQEQPNVRLALRNGAVMALKNPVFSVIVLLVFGVLLWISMLLVVVNLLAGPMLVAFGATRAVDACLQRWRLGERG